MQLQKRLAGDDTSAAPEVAAVPQQLALPAPVPTRRSVPEPEEELKMVLCVNDELKMVSTFSFTGINHRIDD